MPTISYSIDIEVEDLDDTRTLEKIFDDFEKSLIEAGYDEFDSYQQDGEDNLLVPR